MEYADFYDIAVYGNENWKGSFTAKEIACNAFEYYTEYQIRQNGKPNYCIGELIKLLQTDLSNMSEFDPDKEQVKYWISMLVKGE